MKSNPYSSLRNSPSRSYGIPRPNVPDDKHLKAQRGEEISVSVFSDPRYLATLPEEKAKEEVKKSRWTCYGFLLFTILILCGLMIGVYFAVRANSKSEYYPAGNFFSNVKQNDVVFYNENTEKEIITKHCGLGYKLDANQIYCERDIPNGGRSDGIDHLWIDAKSDPCRNFYQYACGNFINDEINQQNHADAVFRFLSEQNTVLLQSIVNKTRSSSRQAAIVRNFFDSCQIESSFHDAMSRLGVTGSLLARIDGIRNKDDVAAAMGFLTRYHVSLPFEINIALHPLNSTKYVMTAFSPELNYDEEIVSLIKKHNIVNNIDEFTVQNMIEELKYDKPDGMNFIEYVDSGLLNRDLLDINQLVEACAPFSLIAFTNAMNLNVVRKSQQPVWMNKKSIRVFASVFQLYDVEQWKHFLYYMTCHHLFRYEYKDQSYTHPYDALYAVPWDSKPKKFVTNHSSHCQALIESYLPVHLNSLFLPLTPAGTEHVSRRVIALVERAKQRIIARVQKIGDFDAVHKMKSVQLQVGGPTHYPLFEHDEGIFMLHPTDIVEQHGHSDKYQEAHSAKEKVVEKRKEIAPFYDYVIATRHMYMLHTISLLNHNHSVQLDDLFFNSISQPLAYYHYRTNKLTINAGIIRPPMYHPSYDDVAASSRLLVIVMHEMVHSIDARGKRFDATGSLLTDKKDTLTRDSMCFLKEYSGVSSKGTPSDGVKTLTENAADIEGFRAAYDTLFADENLEKNWNKYSAMERLEAARHFFLGFAQLLCDAGNEKMYQGLHSFPEFRVDKVVKQHADFPIIWGCPHERKTRYCSLFGD